MEEKNRVLLGEVIETRLVQSLSGCENGDKSFDEAMKAIDRQLELLKIEADIIKTQDELELKKQEAENEVIKNEAASEATAKELELKKKESKRNAIIKVVEIGAIIIIAPLVDFGAKKAFAKLLCEFEKDYTFTTMAGRSLSNFFKFKK